MALRPPSISDVEGDNLLPKLTKLHSAVAIEVASGKVHDWKPWELEGYLEYVQECEELIGHNFVDYDIRAIQKIYPHVKRPAKISDTLIYCKVLWPADTMWGRDLKLRDRGILPPRLLKSHSLEAWGYRLGIHKGDFKGPWDVWSEDMHSYMIQDGHVNLALWKLIRKRLGWDDPSPQMYIWPTLPFEIEHGCAEIIAEQETTGIGFDKDKAVRLAQGLRNAQADLEVELVKVFGSWWAPKDDPNTGHAPAKDRKVKLQGFPDVTIPRVGKNGKALKPYVGPPFEHYTAGAPYVRIERVTFTPSSRDHLGQRLQAVYGWKPMAYGADGKPTVDESTIKTIPESVLPADIRQLVLDYFVVSKTLGQLIGGRKSWLQCYNELTESIHGRMNTLGAITGRGIHYDPNLSQVPSVVKNKQNEIVKGIEGGFGWECRSLFKARGEDEELTGTDASSLELILLGHYLFPYDEGVFAERVSDPTRDPHQEHAEITGENRHDTKTVTYLSIYGGGAARAAEELSLDESEIDALLQYKQLPHLLKWEARKAGDAWREPDDRSKALLAKGHKVIKAFENGIPGWKDLKQGVSDAAAFRKWLKGLDGRKLYVRKIHAALNTLLQGAGAIVCKLWMVLLRKKLIERGLVPGKDFRQVLWAHDELQIEHRKGLGGIIGACSQEAIQEAGAVLGLRAKLRSDFKTGPTWAHTH